MSTTRRRARRSHLAGEFWRFLKANKKWWLIPIVLVFLLLAAVAVLSASGVAPLMYTIF
jgi:hypothetical protein